MSCWSNSLWQGWSCGLVHCPGGNATDPIWRVLASSTWIFSRTTLKPQHSNPNPNPLANKLWCIFEIHQLWQSGFSRVYSNSWCNCSFESEIIKIGLSSHKMYNYNILNFQESTTILNACAKIVWKLIENTIYIYIYIYIYIVCRKFSELRQRKCCEQCSIAKDKTMIDDFCKEWKHFYH